MLPFRIQLESGESASDQIVAAVKRSLVSGALRPGDDFPSVREISKELRINPKTAQKAAAALITEGVLETRPGLGSVVSSAWSESQVPRRELIERLLGELSLEARMGGMSLAELKRELESKWKELDR